MKVFIFIFTSLALINFSSSYTHHLLYDVDCDFKTQQWSIGEVYICTIESQLIVTERQIGISAMNGKHEAAKSVANVNAFHVYLRTVNFIPDFTPVTNNLIAISIVRSRLLRLRKQDLKPYDKLVYLWLVNNYLKHLEGDVFIYNPNLKVINLQENKLTKIDPNIFNNLKSLTALTLNENDCLKDVKKDAKLTVAEWIDKINEKCQNFPEPVIPRPREEYKRNVREKTSIWVTFGVTFGTFTVAVIVIVLLYTFKKFVWL